MKIVAIIQARMGSTRLPQKTLMDISGRPMLAHVISRVEKCEAIDHTIVATTQNIDDNPIIELGNHSGIQVYAGDEHDVLDRYVQASKWVQADLIVRATGDCPLIDPAVLSDMIDYHISENADYTGNLAERSFPRGLDAEVVSAEALYHAHAVTKLPHHREHVTPFIYENPDIFHLASFKAPDHLHFPQFRLCIDTPQDMELVRKIYSLFYKPGEIVQIAEVIAWLREHPEIASMNIASEREHLDRNTQEGIRQKFI